MAKLIIRTETFAGAPSTIFAYAPALQEQPYAFATFALMTIGIGPKPASEEACDRYIKGFKKVLKLHGDGIPAENIASELEMSKSLVRQYVEIIEDLAEMKKE